MAYTVCKSYIGAASCREPVPFGRRMMPPARPGRLSPPVRHWDFDKITVDQAGQTVVQRPVELWSKISTSLAKLDEMAEFDSTILQYVPVAELGRTRSVAAEGPLCHPLKHA